jgi:peptide/nickel transport system ATP-binding protein
MEPVISFEKPADAKAHDILPEDSRLGSGPGFAGEPPLRPHGKVASPGAAIDEETVEQREASARTRRYEVRDETGDRGGAPLGNGSEIAPQSPLQVGEGRQAVDPDVPSAFEARPAEFAEMPAPPAKAKAKSKAAPDKPQTAKAQKPAAKKGRHAGIRKRTKPDG